MAERLKEAKKNTSVAKLNDVPTSPRKMRLVADTVRGVEVNRALDLLKFSKREASVRLEKLLRSAIANWEAKNPEQSKELQRLCEDHHGGRRPHAEAHPSLPAGPCRSHPQAFQPRHRHPRCQTTSGE